MTKLHNVMGRIDYITSTVKQENLYAVYATQPLRSFWKDLAKCNREEFAKSGTTGKCIEARELIIALPEGLYHYEHDYLIKHFATDFKKKYRYDVIVFSDKFSFLKYSSNVIFVSIKRHLRYNNFARNSL